MLNIIQIVSDNLFLGHISPESGTALNIANGIIDFLNEHQISTNNLAAIGCDGANVNIGRFINIFLVSEIYK